MQLRLLILLKRMFIDRIDRLCTRQKEERSKSPSATQMLEPVTRRVTAVMAYTSCHVTRQWSLVTRRVESCSEAPARCPKGAKITAPLRDRHGYFQPVCPRALAPVRPLRRNGATELERRQCLEAVCRAVPAHKLNQNDPAEEDRGKFPPRSRLGRDLYEM
jgi:hypothetical protein